MKKLSLKEILDLKMQPNDACAKTIRKYFVKLLKTLWIEGEGFNGKRPFGNSGWDYDIYRVLVQAKVIEGSFDENGYLDNFDKTKGNKVILSAIEELGK